MPHKFYLPHALPNEKIILLVRRHWFVLYLRLLLWAIVGSIPMVLALLLPGNVEGMAGSTIGYLLLVVGLSGYYLLLWLFVLHSFVDYWLDVWIVTNERIINIEQNQLFSRTAAEQKLSRVQDVTSEINGMFATFLHFGDVHVQTAGEKARFAFEQVPKPTEIARKITSLAELKRHAEQARNGNEHQE